MNQITKARRKLFEEWYVADVRENTGFEITVKEVEKRRGDKGDYIDYPAMHGKWVGFNGALDSIVIDLPSRWQLGPNGSDEAWHQCVVRNDALSQIRQSIESTGLGLRVKP